MPEEATRPGHGGGGSAGPRIKRTINTGWTFHKGDVGAEAGPPFDDAEWERVDLPHCWNAEDVLTDEPGYYRGVCWYQVRLRVPTGEARRHFLLFEGANQDAIVYVNGHRAGEHLGGYTAFAFGITDLLEDGGDAVITVRLTNALNPDIPPLAGDLMHFGGIYRSVHLIETAAVHFDLEDCAASGVFVDTPEVSREAATVRLRGRVVNDGDDPRELRVTSQILDADGEAVLALDTQFSVEAGDACEFTQGPERVESPRLWSPEDPHLYGVTTALVDEATGRVLDAVTVPLGFRWFSVDADSGFHLNGERCFIKGVGKHQDYPGLGYAVPDEVHRDDVRRAREMGANFVRSHYPQPKALYAACDRQGVMSWVKIPIMQKIAHTPAYARNTRRMVREMILQNYNHPSVIIWGYMCEVLGDMDWYWPQPRDPEEVAENMRRTREFVLDLEDYLRELDPFRLTANDHHSSPTPEWYVEAGLTGVSTFEGWFDYAGWYSRSLERVGEVMDLTRALNPDSPYLLAEYGAGSDPRIHTHEPTVQDFSSEYQVLFHRTCIREVAEREWVAGAFIWTLFDFQVKARPDTMPHFNNKGVLRADRRPKDVYHLYRAHWSHEPVVHVATTDWTERTVVPDPDGTFEAPLRVFSNLDEVELHHNGRSLGVKAVRDREVSWQVRFVEGVNRLEAVASGAGEPVRDLAEVHYRFIPRDLRSAPLPGDRLCVNVGQSRTYFRDPVTGNCWVPDRAYRRNAFGHVDGEYYRTWTGTPCWDGVREGVHYGIRGTRLDPVFQTFLVGVTDYRFDVGDGCYDVSLYFTEPFPQERRRDPAERTGADEGGRRVFDVGINGRTCMTGLELAARYGDRRPVVETFRVDLYDGEGIRLRLVPRVGRPVLSGAMLRQVR